ncbi:MAG: HAMP domain-containing histidine kinase [Cyclobacteriaceae bacterium]|nr:HAMP domain-containing histidine kinase [Cyclobacteriaceae bacterium]
MEIKEENLNDIINMIISMASLDFTKNISFNSKNEEMSAISLGLNMLSEELNTQVVHKEELNKVNQKLIRFAHITAHDLKSPINTSIGLIQLIEMCVDSGQIDDIRIYTSKLRMVNENLKSMISGILKNSKNDKWYLDSEDVDLNEVIQQIIEQKRITTNNINILVKGTLPTIPFNKVAAYQLFINLIDNAIKYCDKQLCKIIVHCSELEEAFQIQIEDNGPGISTEYHNQIFEEFNQVNPKENQNSVGIGLATVKGIIESYGGRIWVESKMGKGTTFIFTLKK